MLPLIVPISALLAGVGLLLLGSGLLNTLIALRGSLEGYDESSMGFIMSGYFLGFLLGTFVALPLIQRIGHIRAFAFCAAIISCGALLHSLVVNPYSWFIFRLFYGAILVVLYTIIESWLNGLSNAQNRGKIFSVYMIVNLGALAIAQQLLRFGSPEAHELFILSAMLISLSLVPVTWTRLQQPEIGSVERIKFKQLYNLAPLAVMATIASGLAMGAFWGMTPIFAKEVGLDTNAIAAFLSIGIVGGAIFQYPIGRYSDTHDRRLVLAISSGLAALAGIALFVATYLGSWIYLAVFIYGGMSFAIYPLAIAHIADYLDSDDILSGISSLLLLYGIGAAIGPAIAGQLMFLTGPQALTIFFAVVQFVLSCYAIYLLRMTTEDHVENHTHFVAMVRTTPTAINMYPDEQVDPVDDQK
ncbi:MAG: MFS transporter [Gammaproteobacteria bacterium]